MEFTVYETGMELEAESIIKPLLKWYGRHKRDLPWRMARPDAYRTWLSEIMLQQTTVQAVIPYFLKFTEKYPTVRDLAAAEAAEIMKDWAGLGYYSRARNLHACARAVAAAGGSFPRDVAELRALPGIGEYTAGAIASIAFGQKASVVDGNVERVIARLYAIKTPLPAAKPDIRAKAAAIYMDKANTAPADLPQAFMDLGATICTPANPKCMSCPVSDACAARKLGIQNELPAREKKAAKPKRKGFVYWVTDRQGRVLAHTRPPRGLLGGMTGLPTSDWNDAPEHLADFTIDRIEKNTVRHVFTHFELTLTIVRASVKKPPKGYGFIDTKDAGFPGVFAKVVKMAAA